MSEHIRTQFIKWAEELKYLVHIIVPRWLELNDDIQYMSVHTFTDTSEKSYAAVVFVRAKGATRAIQNQNVFTLCLRSLGSIHNLLCTMHRNFYIFLWSLRP